MKEFNKHNLIEALQALPEYAPDEKLWNNISENLKKESIDAPLKACIADLPAYEPPTAVWEHIQHELANPKQPAKIIRLKRTASYAIAATVAVLLAAFIWLLTDTTNPIDLGTGSIAYRTEIVSDNLLAHDWNEDEDGFELVKNICNQHTFKCDNPEFKALQAELEELNEAKHELEYAIGTYGTNPDLIAQIRDIELARTDLVEKIIQKVI